MRRVLVTVTQSKRGKSIPSPVCYSFSEKNRTGQHRLPAGADGFAGGGIEEQVLVVIGFFR
jgi:hypothetical protein